MLNLSRSQQRDSLLKQASDNVRQTAVRRWDEELRADVNNEYNCEAGFDFEELARQVGLL